MLRKSGTSSKLPCGRDRPRPRNEARETQDPHAVLKAFLSKQGLKFTEQRWTIARLILASRAHLSAQEIVEVVRKKDSTIGAATVYRTIKVLQEASLLKESFADESGTMHYEAFEDEHHDHIVCLDCGEVFEFHDETIEAKQETLTRGFGFEQKAHRHVIFGKCTFQSRKRGGDGD